MSAACGTEADVIKPVKVKITGATKIERWVEGREEHTKNVSEQSTHAVKNGNAVKSTQHNDSAFVGF